MTDLAFQLAHLAPGDRSGFDAMLRIYQRSIEPSEQKSASEIAAIAGNPSYSILVLSVNGEVRGFSISFFPSGDFWLLEYLAVDESLRSHGFGRTLFLAAKNAAYERNPNAPCILEVDDPSAGPTPDNNAARRFRFYRGLGCRRIEGLDYILPLAANGTPPRMTLLVHGIDDRDTLPKGQLARWLETIYRDVYARHSNDPRLVTMMSPLPDNVCLESF